MMIKQLFIHTSTMLRSALLLGALVFVNNQVEAQMPDAFETMNPSKVIGDGQYYYVQFYAGGVSQYNDACDRSYLSDQGADNVVRTKDYIPFAKNIQWTLLDKGDNQFVLKSLSGNYVYLDEGTFKCTSDENVATPLMYSSQAGGGFQISAVASPDVAMFRADNNVWADVINENKNAAGNCLRIAKLKSNIAHIIYYQDENINNGGKEGFTTRHYLNNPNGVGQGWTSLINNGDFEGTDASSFNRPITDGDGRDGTRGVRIESRSGQSQAWSTQFFVYSSRPLQAGEQIMFEFDVKASRSVSIGTQAQGNPGHYSSGFIGNLNLTTEWQRLGGTVEVTSAMASQDGGLKTIAFDLGMTGDNPSTFYFDNIVFSVKNNSAAVDIPRISTYSSIMNTYDAWALPTAAAYHQDGLWTLEETADGEFAIKKYDGNSNQYVSLSNGVYELGANKATFQLDQANANRYTPIKNTAGNYFNSSNGDGSNVTNQAAAGRGWGFLPVEVLTPNEDHFYKVLPVFGENMLNYQGSAVAVDRDHPVLWQLEQLNDFNHFRFSAYENYLRGPNSVGSVSNARIYSYNELVSDFALEWFRVPELDREVTHKISYLKKYADEYAGLDLGRQGLATNAQSDWWDYENRTQRVNHFEITHYVKKGQQHTYLLPTAQNSNDHTMYQRWYNYDDEADLESILSHVTLNGRDNRSVAYYLYKNGLVTGEGVYWGNNDDNMLNAGQTPYAHLNFTYTNTDGKSLTVAADVSRYSDLKYKNEEAPLEDNLEEPSLTMRYLYYMKDAKEMAAKLTSFTKKEDADVDDKNWMESKVIHFPSKRLAYEQNKLTGYRGEFIGLRHIFSDYWVFDGQGTGDDNLVSGADPGNIRVVIYDPHGTGIRLGGFNPNVDLKGTAEGNDGDYQGFYYHDRMYPWTDGGVDSYGDSRFVVFRYPASGTVVNNGESNPAYLRVYFVAGNNRYQLAQYTIIFEKGTYGDGSATLPWTPVNGGRNEIREGDQYNRMDFVQGTPRDPNQLRLKAGKPIAKISFDYPENSTYHFPDVGLTNHGQNSGNNDSQPYPPGGTIENSSPIPLTFAKNNYAFDGENSLFGAYALLSNMPTRWGNQRTCVPSNDATDGYNIGTDNGYQSGFLYIDASELPGDICSAPFVGDFCAGDKLMVSGWISGANNVRNGSNKPDRDGARSPGGITLTLKGEHTVHGQKVTETLYRFCPGMCYELDNGTSSPDGYNGDHVVWQQFYFEFTVKEKFDRHWIEVNNNCVSSQGGDFMLDNIEVYTIVPEIEPQMNTPICVDQEGKVDMRMLRLDVDFNSLTSTAQQSDNPNGDGHYMGFVFLEKDAFLKELKNRVAGFKDKPLEELADSIARGKVVIPEANQQQQEGVAYITEEDYKAAFDAALLRKDGETKTVWVSDQPEANKGSGLMYFKWSTTFDDPIQPLYTFGDAINRRSPVFRYTDEEGFKKLVFNGNYPDLPWKASTEYYLIPSTALINVQNETDWNENVYKTFNLCSPECTRASVFKIEPPLQILSMETSDVTQDLEVCEGKIPTLLVDLKGYNWNGTLVPLKNLNFDWWLGDLTTDPEHPLIATLSNYHNQKETVTYEKTVVDEETHETHNETVTETDVKLDRALSMLRAYYPDVTTLDGVIPQSNDVTQQNLTQGMILYLKELVDAGQLVLHQKSINIHVKKTSEDDPYCYLVACPIHDGFFDQALNNGGHNDVAYFCDEPQGVRIIVGDKSPTLQCGFVPNENGFSKYNYPVDSDPVLSIRLAKKAQFMTVQHGMAAEEPNDGSSNTDLHYLWLPIRNAKVQTSTSTFVMRRSDDYNVYLSSTNDPEWDQQIYSSMNNGLLPIVGKIVTLNAIDVDKYAGVENDNNRLCIYFTENFEVREGYNYTLSLPFREDGNENTCDGTILINLKIVPDYEVWTGAAGNTDWNNDENWRRADGNPANNGLNQDELYVVNAATTSPLYQYKTNEWNYRTDNDRVFRKGFAPLYCTHVLMMSNEWGNAPVLYDALDSKSNLSASPFPNLRETSTPVLKYDMQARLYDLWEETYGMESNKGREGDLIAEMYQINTCDEIAMQPGTELLNAHLLNYNNAWMEYQLDNKRWYLLGSPLQGTISGEWYAPTGTAKQKTTYYDPVRFGAGYDRYSPAIYQRSWDKAKAVLYEVGSTYATGDDSQTENLGSYNEGLWGNSGDSWQTPTTGADEYLDRLGYKPIGNNKANVAIKGIWSNTYNDAQVDYANGGFSVMVMNHLKNNDSSEGKSIVRLPKEDTMYDYYKFEENGSADGSTDTDLSTVQTEKNRALNRGRLKTDLLLPVSTNKTEKNNSVYGDKRTYTRVPTTVGEDALPMTLRSYAETVPAGLSNLGFYLVENPFPCGLDMDKFFEGNSALQKKYWLLTATGQHLVQRAADTGEWISPDESTSKFATANAVLAPGQGFFVQGPTGESVTVTFTKDMQAQSRFGVKSDTGTTYTIVVGKKQKMKTIEVDDDNDPNTPAITVEVPETDNAGNYILEDLTEEVIVYHYEQNTDENKKYPLKSRTRSSDMANALGLVITAQRGENQSSALVMQRESASDDFLPSEDTEVFLNSDLKNVPTVYTLCGRLATTINSIRDFRSLPLGVESASDAPCVLTFQGVETLGDSVAFYDAVEQKLTPLESGMQFSVSGQTQNRYYLVRTLNLLEAKEETHLQIFAEGLMAKVIASTEEPITSVSCYDASGRLVYTAKPDAREHSFKLPDNGVYIIEAQTDNDRKTKKVMVK